MQATTHTHPFPKQLHERSQKLVNGQFSFRTARRVSKRLFWFPNGNHTFQTAQTGFQTVGMSFRTVNDFQKSGIIYTGSNWKHKPPWRS